MSGSKTFIIIAVLGFTFCFMRVDSKTYDEIKEEFRRADEICAYRNKVSLDILPVLSKSDDTFKHNRTVKCFLHCLFTIKNFFKGNKYDHEYGLKWSQEAPVEMQDFAYQFTEKCRFASEGLQDPCEAAYSHHMCIGQIDRL